MPYESGFFPSVPTVPNQSLVPGGARAYVVRIMTAVCITIGPSGTYYAGGRALDLGDASDLYASVFQNLNLSCLLP